MPLDFYIFVAIALSYLYVIMSQYFSYKKCNFFQETSVAIILGTLFGLLLFFLTDVYDGDELNETIRGLIFLILLPPMLFEDGYNIRKRKFFQNIFYVNLYGIFGTICNFFFIFGFIYAFSANGLITTISSSQPLILQNWQILVIAACLCSIDTVVPQKIINPERYPKLFSIIFGQSILKDTITVTLFDAIISVYNRLQNNNIEVVASDAGILLLEFLIVMICSVLIGVMSAIITTLIFKHFRFLLNEKGVAQVALIVLTGYGGYIISQWCNFSGVVSMLFCGITLSHFNIYNLTSEGKNATKVAVSVLALLAEGILFFLLGAFIFLMSSQAEGYFSYILILLMLGGILIGRFFNIYLMSFLGYFILGKDKWRLNYYEYQIIFLSGLVKGAVPFALIMSCPYVNNRDQVNRCTGVLQVALICVIYFGSLVLNSIMPKILRNRRKKIFQMKKENPTHPSLEDSLLVNPRTSIESEQPNTSTMITQDIAFYRKMKSTTQKYWRRCEEGCLKPHLIYDYHSRKDQIKEEKLQRRREEIQEYWEESHIHHDEEEGSVEEQKKFDLQLLQLYFSDEQLSQEEQQQPLPSQKTVSEQEIQPLHRQSKSDGESVKQQ